MLDNSVLSTYRKPVAIAVSAVTLFRLNEKTVVLLIRYTMDTIHLNANGNEQKMIIIL